MATDLTGKIALITGGGQGVGQGVALAMAGAGASLVLFGRTLAKLEVTAAMITERGGKALTVAGDVASADDLGAAVQAAVDGFGGVDILVNNAQVVPNGPLEKVTDEAFLAGFTTGPLAVLRLMKLVRPIMAARGGGVIFTLGSSAGIRWDMAGYGA